MILYIIFCHAVTHTYYAIKKSMSKIEDLNQTVRLFCAFLCFFCIFCIFIHKSD